MAITSSEYDRLTEWERQPYIYRIEVAYKTSTHTWHWYAMSLEVAQLLRDRVMPFASRVSIHGPEEAA